jgi:hypothetical protein
MINETLSPNEAMEKAKQGENWTFHCRLFDILDKRDRGEYEELMNRQYRNDPYFEMVKEETTFGKNDNYLIMLRWIEVQKSEENFSESDVSGDEPF